MSVFWGIIPAVVVVIAGAWLIARPAVVALPGAAVRRRTAWGTRLATARAQLKETVRPAGAWVVLCGAGLAICVAVLWPLGRLALRLEGAWDRPVLVWFRDHQGGPGWTRLMEILTQIGNRPTIYVAACAAAVVLVPLAPRRRRLVPSALVVLAVLIEQYMRVGLTRVVDRGHPPTSLGTWPSGGVGRIIAIYGFIAVLLVWCAKRRAPRVAGRRTAVAVGVLIALMATVEGYTRVYLLKHWLTDVLGGYVFGGLLLVVFVYAGRVLFEERADRDRAEPAAEAAAQAVAGATAAATARRNGPAALRVDR
jgi:membrane-associated phospholipid phosphatase